MAKKKDLLTREEKDSCSKFVSGNNNKSLQEQLSKLLDEMQISLDEPIVEDSIDSTRIRITYVIALSRRGGGRIDEDAIRFQYIKEIPVDYSNIPIKIRDRTNVAAASAADDTVSHNNNSIGDDTIIESYDELENIIPTLCEVLGLLKRIYFMPEDFSNRLVVDRIHKLRNMFSKDEILAFPSANLRDKAGLIPIWIGQERSSWANVSIEKYADTELWTVSVVLLWPDNEHSMARVSQENFKAKEFYPEIIKSIKGTDIFPGST